MRPAYPYCTQLLTRFASFFERGAPDKCWEWAGTLNPKGYARLHIRAGGRQIGLRAYCVSWEIENARVWPEGKMACHSCDNPRCVNPHHVRPGTAADNYADQLERGRLGTSPAARNVHKTHCAHGHPLEGENLYIRPSGHRTCRTCHRKAALRYHHKRKAA